MNRFLNERIKSNFFCAALKKQYSFANRISKKAVQLPDQVDTVIIGKN